MLALTMLIFGGSLQRLEHVIAHALDRLAMNVAFQEWLKQLVDAFEADIPLDDVMGAAIGCGQKTVDEPGIEFLFMLLQPDFGIRQFKQRVGDGSFLFMRHFDLLPALSRTHAARPCDRCGVDLAPLFHVSIEGGNRLGTRRNVNGCLRLKDARGDGKCFGFLRHHTTTFDHPGWMISRHWLKRVVLRKLEGEKLDSCDAGRAA